MTYRLPAATGPVNDLALQIGGLVAFSVRVLVAVPRSALRGRLSVREIIEQTAFLARVCSGPALLLMLPIGVLIAVSVGSLASRLGAGGYSGAVTAFVVVGQAAALVCALMLAGVGGSAICADLGSRTIREEIEAMETMGLDVIERLAVPRVVAAVVVSIVLCALVTLAGLLTCMLYQVYVQNEGAGAFLNTLSQYGRLSDFTMAMIKSAFFGLTSALIASFRGLHAKGGPSGVADAVNETVVLAFVVVFVVNTVLSQLYSVIVPAPGAYA